VSPSSGTQALQSGASVRSSSVPTRRTVAQQYFEHYLSQSEQLPAFLRLYADGGALCGLLLEKLPDADRRDPDGWDRVHAARATLSSTKHASQPYDLLRRVPEKS